MVTGSSRFASSVRVKYTISHPAKIIGVCPGPMKNASPASNTSTVTEYQVAAKQCPECGEVSVGLALAGVTGRVQYGPGVHAKAAWRSARTTCPSPAPRSWSPR